MLQAGIEHHFGEELHDRKQVQQAVAEGEGVPGLTAQFAHLAVLLTPLLKEAVTADDDQRVKEVAAPGQADVQRKKVGLRGQTKAEQVLGDARGLSVAKVQHDQVEGHREEDGKEDVDAQLLQLRGKMRG